MKWSNRNTNRMQNLFDRLHHNGLSIRHNNSTMTSRLTAELQLFLKDYLRVFANSPKSFGTWCSHYFFFLAHGATHCATRLFPRCLPRTVRRVQRTQAAVECHQLLQQISETSENDPKLFHRLIKKQRDNGQGTVSLLIDGRTVTEETEIRESWAKYYENLADPGQPNTERSRMVDYMRILSRLNTTAISVTPDFIRKAITRLNNGKATDRYGVAAEQLKMLTPKALGTLATIVNKIFQTRRVHDFMKMSYKLPIPKKDKDQRIQDNHRGITIAPIITKVLETVCLESGLSTDIKTNGLQFGFAIGKSPSMATLLVTEAIAEAKANRTPLYIATLDARKAFDVVNHQVLKTKLYNSPICGRLWNMIDDLYTGGNEVIRWNGKYSSPYQVKQGVKQGVSCLHASTNSTYTIC